MNDGENSAAEIALQVLIVDDDEAVRDSMSGFLRSRGWCVKSASSASEALEVLAKCDDVDVVITDVRMPGMSGISLLGEIRKRHPHVEVLICTGFSNESLAISALRAGAFDYFRKPLDGNEVAAALERTRRYKNLQNENSRLRAVIAKQSSKELGDVVIGENGGMRTILKQVRRVAEIPTATVLLTGESGAGKEVVARLIHRLGHPPGAPFVALNCGGIAETLLEAELFGHEKGAFTGAVRATAGVFEMAKGGTVLLDEISEMSSAAQSRFLRVLEERTLRRLGGSREIDVRDTRVIAATNRDLTAMVAAGDFRQDLYYRIQVACIHVPPLRERRNEIPALARRFLERAATATDRQFELTAAGEAALLAHDYPGNVRELRNLIDRACIFADDCHIGPRELGLHESGQVLPLVNRDAESQDDSESPLPTLEAAERQLIETAVARHPGNLSAAARALGLTPQTMYRRLAKFGLSGEDSKS